MTDTDRIVRNLAMSLTGNADGVLTEPMVGPNGLKVDAKLEASELEIGSIVIKDDDDDTTAKVGADGLEVEIKKAALPSGASTDSSVQAVTTAIENKVLDSGTSSVEAKQATRSNLNMNASIQMAGVDIDADHPLPITIDDDPTGYDDVKDAWKEVPVLADAVVCDEATTSGVLPDNPLTRGVTLKAGSLNAATIIINDHFELEPGESLPMDIENTNLIDVSSITAGDKLMYIGG